VAHALRQAQRVDEGFIRVGVVPHPATAGAWPALGRMKRDDRPKTRLRIEEMMDALMAGEGRLVEHVQLSLGRPSGRLRCGPRTTRRAYSAKPMSGEPGKCARSCPNPQCADYPAGKTDYAAGLAAESGYHAPMRHALKLHPDSRSTSATTI